MCAPSTGPPSVACPPGHSRTSQDDSHRRRSFRPTPALACRRPRPRHGQRPAAPRAGQALDHRRRHQEQLVPGSTSRTARVTGKDVKNGSLDIARPQGRRPPLDKVIRPQAGRGHRRTPPRPTHALAAPPGRALPQGRAHGLRQVLHRPERTHNTPTRCTSRPRRTAPSSTPAPTRSTAVRRQPTSSTPTPPRATPSSSPTSTGADNASMTPRTTATSPPSPADGTTAARRGTQPGARGHERQPLAGGNGPTAWRRRLRVHAAWSSPTEVLAGPLTVGWALPGGRPRPRHRPRTRPPWRVVR